MAEKTEIHSLSSRGQKSEIKALAEEELFQAFLLGLQVAIFSLCLFTSPSLCVSVRNCVLTSCFYKDTGHIGLGLTLLTSLELDDLCKVPISK